MDASGGRWAESEFFLSEVDDDWRWLVRAVGPCLHESKPAREPYEALVRAVAYQQLHAKAGDALVARLKALFPGEAFPSPASLAGAAFDDLRACGFSGSKIETIQGIAAGAARGLVPGRAEADGMSDDELVTRLVALKGVGRWTVEMLLMYTLERSDVLPADDFGVREGYRALKGLDAAPSAKAIRALSAPWSPHRSAATWYLWRARAARLQSAVLQAPGAGI